MSPACDDIQPRTAFIIPALYNLNLPSRFEEKFESTTESRELREPVPV